MNRHLKFLPNRGVKSLFAVTVTVMATPVFGQGSGSGAAATGIAGLIGMFGLFGFLLALVYSVLLFLLPFMVWDCLKRLTSIRDDVRAIRLELTGLAKKAAGLSSPGEKYQVQDVATLQRLVKENEKSI